MGVRGLHSFMTSACPESCAVVNLKEMAENHCRQNPGSDPVIVVDAMSCLRHWYTPESWVCGGQWREYHSSLDGFIKAFMAAGIKLVFYFDGVVEQKKRDEWVKRRLKNNKEIARIFQVIKASKQQPRRSMFFIPSGLATFTRFALKTLGQETICSLQEADYEVASYGQQNNCMGILGEDTDYLIYDTSPYFSINNLCLDKLETIMYSRQNLCRNLGLQVTELPLLACLLGTDTVPEWAMAQFRNQCVASYDVKSQGSGKKTSVIPAVAHYISTLPRSYESLIVLAENVPLGLDKSILSKGIESYLLPGQMSPWLLSDFSYHSAASLKQDVPLCLDQEIFQIAKEQHVRAESYMIYNVLSGREVECSNTLEDEYDTELPSQAHVYCLVRQHIYSILLESAKDVEGICPVVKEWFVYPGNPLQQPDLVQPKQLPGGTPGLRSLWLSRDLEAEKQRYHTFLACFQLEDVAEDLRALGASTEAACSLLIYLTLQVDSLSTEDLHAFMAQALCLEGKPAAQLADLQLAQIDSRAVQLGSLFVRGLCILLTANSACGFPFRVDSLMPWQVFDGKLFQQKYQQAHRGCTLHELLEGNKSWLTKFQNLMSLICKACAAKGRNIQNRQRLTSSMTGRQEGAEGSHFPNRGRAHTYPYSRHHQNREKQWRGPSSESHYPGLGYRSRHQPSRGQRFQLAPRWPR
ncbi:constitutive coactivator of peroxisome proliferator-activated receptor gamma isoform X1 [Anolis carolinensis]|uniref:constitutive coactivator of peroxisome proliferator-activated receptor gamma isoform X1 n=2 Tax=Anolis carolinensis TaxID=28377 RepID=UPI002F2B7312